MNQYADAPNIVRKFLNYKLTIQNRSVKTVFQYYHDLRTFSRYLLLCKDEQKYSNMDFSEIPFCDATDELLINVSSDDIFDFISFTANTLKNEVSARQRKLSCIKSFYKYLKNILMLVDKNPSESIDSPSKSKKLPKFLTLEESIRLLSSISGKNAVRDYCIVTLFLNCGMRVSELVGINLSDLSDDLKTVNVTGKGSKERMLYLNDACTSAIEAYLKVRPTSAKLSDRNALFISRNNNRLSVQMVQSLIYRHLKNAGLENRNMSVHKLRHTAATLMYQHGKTDVRVLKDILGHEQLSTTQIYTHINNEMIKDASNSNPLSGIKQKRNLQQTDTMSINRDDETNDNN